MAPPAVQELAREPATYSEPVELQRLVILTAVIGSADGDAGCHHDGHQEDDAFDSCQADTECGDAQNEHAHEDGARDR